MPIHTQNNFIITGIPRSGTTLLCHLVNRIANVVCFNEVVQAYNVPHLPSFFIEMYQKLQTGQLVPMDVDADGEIITDTQTQADHSHPGSQIVIDPSRPLFLGSKINWPYLSQLDTLKQFGYELFTVVRHPLYVIASWNKHERNINEAHVMPEDWEQWPRYSQVSFRADDKFGRQAEVWNIMAKMILDGFPKERIFKYEDLVSQTQYRLMYLCSQIGTEYQVSGELPELTDHNSLPGIHEGVDTDAIHAAILKYAPAAGAFGYTI